MKVSHPSGAAPHWQHHLRLSTRRKVLTRRHDNYGHFDWLTDGELASAMLDDARRVAQPNPRAR